MSDIDMGLLCGRCSFDCERLCFFEGVIVRGY